MKLSSQIQKKLKKIRLPDGDSHKGQNGKLLVIGGSRLFHSSIFWSADVASRIVDMVHLTSPANENNDLFRFKLKQGFWNGIVVEWSAVESYIQEDDAVLIGPGMERSEVTSEIVNDLINRFSGQKWVIDGGALQMIDPKLLNSRHVITPHQKELDLLLAKLADGGAGSNLERLIQTGATILSKGQTDVVYCLREQIEVMGGNPGLTKGGTGDVLAGLVAGFYCQNEALSSAVVASLVNKRAGEALWQKQGPYFNASDLVEQIPKTLWSLLAG
ncbi:MAG: NAD(P)H-hydrate dehydratase [Patescibacteria group bacterium]|nr:NAD(P)H-hydrate dehydratase [Patescibacteria group bacterium]